MSQAEILKQIELLKKEKHNILGNKDWSYIPTKKDMEQMSYLHCEIVRLNGLLTIDNDNATNEDIQADKYIARLEDYDN